MEYHPVASMTRARSLIGKAYPDQQWLPLHHVELDGSMMTPLESRCGAELLCARVPVSHRSFVGARCTTLHTNVARQMSDDLALLAVVAHWWSLPGRRSAMHLPVILRSLIVLRGFP